MKLDRREIFRTMAYFGGALLLGGLLRYSVQETVNAPTKWFLISGGALLAVGLAGSFREVIGFFRSRSGKLGTNTAVLALGVVAILAVVNFLGYRHPQRFDWTTEKLYTLSDQTQKVVAGLKKDVRVINFDKAKSRDGLGEFVADYRHLSRRVSYDSVDPQEHPDTAREFGARRMGDVVVASGDRKEHLEDVSEQTLTNAILKVTRDTAKVVCVVEGHGEAAVESSEPEGYSSAEKALQGENFEVKPLNLVRSAQVPAECSAVVVAGPKNALFPPEAETLTKYLDGGGKAMLLLDPDTDAGLDGLLSTWNIAVGKNTVIDYSGAGRIIGLGYAVPLVTTYGAHAVTKNFDRSVMTFFPLARTVKAADKQKSSPSVTELLKTSEESWGETNMKENGGKLKFDPGVDEQGPVSLGVAAEKSVEGKSARLVVIGNSKFAANGYLRHQPNRDLFLNAVDWLTLDEDLISIRPKSPTNRRVTLTVAQQNTFFWFSVVFLPGAVIVTGAALWWKRR
jgi:ABC-type uncharacterized transport system involved in gliding motility auxiliary subunit